MKISIDSAIFRNGFSVASRRKHLSRSTSSHTAIESLDPNVGTSECQFHSREVTFLPWGNHRVSMEMEEYTSEDPLVWEPERTRTYAGPGARTEGW